MNAHVKSPQVVSPVAVTDPKIRTQLQLSGLRFAISRAQWFISEATSLGGKISSDQVDQKLAELGALDLVYPELMVSND